MVVDISVVAVAIDISVVDIVAVCVVAGIDSSRYCRHRLSAHANDCSSDIARFPRLL